jgi:transcriptional regulator with XRE-family HTH domain
MDPVAKLRRLCRESSQTAVAARFGVSQGYIADVLRGRREPGKKLLDALGCVRATIYRRSAVVPLR